MGENGLPDIDSLWDYNRPLETEARFRALLPQAEAAGDQVYELVLLTQIARCHSLTGRYEGAHALLDQVAAALDDALFEDSAPFEDGAPALVRVRYLLERGRTLNSSGDPAGALPLFAEALAVARGAGLDGYAVDAVHMLAIAAPLEERLAWHQQAVALAEASSQPQARRWFGALYNNLGWTLHDLGRYEEALATFEKALAWRQTQGDAEATRIARWCVARTFRSLGRCEVALAEQQALLAEYESAPAGALDEPGYTYEELGECLLALDRPAEARPYFALAFDVLAQDTWLQRHEPERLARLRALGYG